MSALSVAEVLDAAADLIEPEGAWTKSELARDRDGRAVSPNDDEAICWCASGAIMRASQSKNPTLEWQALGHAIGGEVIPHWNDRGFRTQAEVVAKLREAAAAARKTGGDA